ncbi:MAG: histidine kinase N-terminal 7TM domain-containing protein [Mariniphaga sp.]
MAIPFRILSQESMIEFIAVLVALGVIILVWKNRKAREVKLLIFLELLAAIWAFMYGLEFTASDLESKKFWSQMSYFGIAFLPVTYFLFTTSFNQKKKVITPLNITILSIIPFLALILVLTNDFHGLIWEDIQLIPQANLITYKYGVGFYLFWTYSILLILAGIYNLFRAGHLFLGYHKSQVLALLIASFFPLIGNLLYITGLNPIPGFDWTPVLFIFSGLVITFGIIRYSMFDLVPFARNKLIDIMCDGVIVINNKGFIENYNPAVERIFNLEPEEAKFKHYSHLFNSHEIIMNALNNIEPQHLEFEIFYQNKKHFYQVKIIPLQNQQKKFSGQVIHINNITSLKESEKNLKDELEERGRLIENLDDFSHTVAHDLRNILGSIASSAEIIEAGIGENDVEFIKEMALLMKDSARKAMNITHELFVLARYTHKDIEKKELDMYAVFEGAKKQLAELITKSKAQFIEPESWPNVPGHATCVELVWTNFLSNAIKHGGSPPVLSVGATPAGNNSIRYWVQDNGNGISPADHDRVFQKYVRLSPEKSEGYGLGLSIVKRVIEKLGGEVGIESTGQKEEGTIFWFELPIK